MFRTDMTAPALLASLVEFIDRQLLSSSPPRDAGDLWLSPVIVVVGASLAVHGGAHDRPEQARGRGHSLHGEQAR